MVSEGRKSASNSASEPVCPNGPERQEMIGNERETENSILAPFFPGFS